ncbi:MAG: IgGFc-binding protein, partial [Myxococcota bacterium]|nr:IgGFc-binding protein [Myxococcota bacterium]
EEDYSPPPGDCTPGDVLCAGPTAIQQCDVSGLEWIESLCEEGQGCADGACVPQICAPGASTLQCIDENSYERCNAGGTAWEVVQCGTAAYCKEGTCISQLCPPGMSICKNFVQLQVCNADGTAWVDGELCPPGGACDNGQCLSPCEVNIKDGSYLGCEFWALDLDNIEDAEFQEVGIVVSVPTDTSPTDVVITNTSTGQVLTPSELGVTSTFVPAGEVKVFALPLGFDVDGSTTTTRTFHIETTTPATVHQFNPLNGEGVYTNDASLLLPSKVTGQQYYVMSWPHRSDGAQTLRGFATVIGSQEGTTEVHVTPTAPVVAGLPGSGVEQQLNPGTTYVFNLEQGQALNLETDGEQGEDLTGTYVQADKKITVFGGHECANVPLGINACDHLEQQLFPVETWSTNYVADAFQKRSPAQVDIWRVMAGDNDVTVTTTPAVPGYETFKLQRGGWLQFASGDSFVIDADGPIMVGNYLTGSSYPGSVIECQNTGIGNDTAIGDPAFTLAAPSKRYLDQYAVLTPTGYLENYLNVIVPNGAIIQIDGAPLNSVATPIPGTDYGIIQELVQPGVHTVVGSVPFGLTAYGYDCDVSYAYPGGLKLQALVDE